MARASLLLAGTLVALAATLPSAGAGCCYGDPSAVDVDPDVEPLRVAHHHATGELLLTWESVGAGYRVWEGYVDALLATGTLNDEVVALVSDPQVQLPSPAGNAYYLVTTDCFGLHCTRGRDSRGNERATPGCEILERGEVYNSTAICLGPGNGVVRTEAEYAAFAFCFDPGAAPDPPAPGETLVWATDYSNAACGTCLEFPCARRFDDLLIVEKAGAPWGDCDAIHNGGAWARVVDAPTITFLAEMPPLPEYHPCP